MSLCATGCPLPALLLGPFLTLVPCSLLLDREETLATRAIGGPRERCHWVLRGGVKKKVIGRGPREQCRIEPRGGVKEKKMIGRRPREQCVSFPLFGRKNALQCRKEHNAKGVWERAESRGLSCCN